MSRRLIPGALCLMLLTTAAYLPGLPADSQSANIREYDWIIEAQTEELKNYLDYPGSKLKPIFKVTVTYKSTDPDKSSQVVKYEDLYFGGCSAIGCRRYHKFDVTSGDGVGIRITSKSMIPAPQESCAAANAITRLLLDSYLNGNSVGSVLLPNSLFGQVVQDLHKQNFYPAATVGPETPDYSTIVLPLRSEPPGLSQMMNYAGKTTD